MAEIIDEYRVQFVLDLEDYKKGMSEAETSAEKLQSKMFAISGNIAKGLTTALATAGAAIGKIATDAINSYADYEQLVGGMETLFKDSADSALQMAMQGYKTARLSANEYMETVTSFSASLLQSLEGDTEAAVQYADMAITDMADNANKMGTDMEMIQNAYQGFAKANYTMLDNLKLGYGGTKEEMARLLADAQAISGIEYDISSYADIVDAIHVIQTEMGITGTTAKEASSTISGSLASAKAAWSNLLVAMANDSMPFEQYVNEFVNSVTTVMDNLLPRISIALNGCVQLVSQLAPLIIAKIPELINTLLPVVINAAIGLVNALVAAMPGIVQALMAALPTLIAGVQQLITGIVTVLPELLQTLVTTAVAVLPMLAQALLDSLPVLLETVLAIISGLAQSILDSIPIIIETLPELINQLVAFLLGAIPMIIETGISLLTSLVSALPDIINTIVAVLPQIVESIITNLLAMIPDIIDAGIKLLISLVQALPTIITTIIDAVPKIVTSICDVFINNIDKIIDAGVTLFIALVENLPTIIVEIVKAVPQIITSLVNAIVQSVPKIAEAGTNLVQGLFNGISNAVSWLYGKLKGWVSSVLSYIKSLFGINSPSKETAVFGKYVAEGLGVGIEDNADAATDAAGKMGEKVLDTFNTLADDVAEIENDMFSGGTAGYTIAATVTTDKASIADSTVKSNVELTSKSLATSLSSIADRLINQNETNTNRLISAINNSARMPGSGGKTVTVNLKNDIRLSGVMEKGVADKIESMIDEAVEAVADSIEAA